MALAGAGSEDEPHGHQQVNHEEQFRGFPGAAEHAPHVHERDGVESDGIGNDDGVACG